MDRKLALVIKAGLVIFGLFLISRALDFLMAWTIYGWIFQPIYEQGVPEQVAGIIAVWFTVVLVIAGPTILIDLIIPNIFPELVRDFLWKSKRHYRRAIYWTAFGFTVWSALMFVISRPGEGELFNKITGKPWYVYSHDAKGEVVLFPKGVRFNPLTGEAVSPLTPEIAKKVGYAPRYHQPRILSADSQVIFVDSTPVIGEGVELTVEYVKTVTRSWSDADTIIGVAVKGASNDGEGWGWLEKAENGYITEDNGRAHLLNSDGGSYTSNDRRYLRPTEIYHFVYGFRDKIGETKTIRLFIPSFPPILIDLENKTVRPLNPPKQEEPQLPPLGESPTLPTSSPEKHSEIVAPPPDSTDVIQSTTEIKDTVTAEPRKPTQTNEIRAERLERIRALIRENDTTDRTKEPATENTNEYAQAVKERLAGISATKTTVAERVEALRAAKANAYGDIVFLRPGTTATASERAARIQTAIDQLIAARRAAKVLPQGAGMLDDDPQTHYPMWGSAVPVQVRGYLKFEYPSQDSYKDTRFDVYIDGHLYASWMTIDSLNSEVLCMRAGNHSITLRFLEKDKMYLDEKLSAQVQITVGKLTRVPTDTK